MDLFEHADYKLPQCDYRVFINGKLVKCVNSEKAAWEVIESYPVGSLFEVWNKEGFCREEFITF